MSKELFSIEVVFDAQQDGVPDEVKDDVRRLWRNFEYGNDCFYHPWDSRVLSEADEFPALAKFINKHYITTCLVHWWW